MAIAINLIIATIPWLIWISLTSASMFGVPILDKMKALLAVALSISLMMIYATLAQLILLLKTPKRSFWAISTIGTAIFLPPIILEFLDVSSWKNPNLWIFSTFPWAAIEYAQTTKIFIAFLADFSILVLLNFQLTRQIKLAGESATKALLSGR